MYTLIGLNRVLAAYAMVVGAATVAVLMFEASALEAAARQRFDLASEVWGALGKGSTIATLLFGAGQTKAFPLLCRWKLLRPFLADLDGTWKGALHSNWPLIRSRLPGAPPQPAPSALQCAPVTAEIRVRLFSVSMTLRSDDTRYSGSETVSMRLDRNPETDRVRVAYVYANTTKNPEDTDSGFHHGAAVLDLEEEDGKPQALDGLYWTNRNWTKGLNTAGTIRLERASP